MPIGGWPALLHHYGYSFVFLLIALEAMGVPLPGETVMIAAALYAARTHRLGLPGLLIASGTGAVVGGALGYLIGRSLGTRLLRLGLSHDRRLLGQYLMQRQGAWLVFFGRFIAVLRSLAALLAGANHMDIRRFMLANVLGGIAWTGLYCGAAYSFGDAIKHVAGKAAIAFAVLAAAAVIAGLLFIRRHEQRLTQAAIRARDAGELDDI